MRGCLGLSHVRGRWVSRSPPSAIVECLRVIALIPFCGAVLQHVFLGGDIGPRFMWQAKHVVDMTL